MWDYEVSEIMDPWGEFAPAVTGIRAKARELLDKMLPPGTVVTSNGATAKKFKEMTGSTQETLSANWAKGGIMTTCNGFTGWYGGQLGPKKKYLGGFDLKAIAKANGTPGAWVVSTPTNRPNYGDVLRHASFHVDVCVGFNGDFLLRAASGQGGPKLGHDEIKRLEGKTAYNWTKLTGWIDIETYFA